MTQDLLPRIIRNRRERRAAYSKPFAGDIQAEIEAIPEKTICVIFSLDPEPYHMSSWELIEQHAQAHRRSRDLLHHLTCFLHLEETDDTFLMLRKNWMNAERLEQMLRLELHQRLEEWASMKKAEDEA